MAGYPCAPCCGESNLCSPACSSAAPAQFSVGLSGIVNCFARCSGTGCSGWNGTWTLDFVSRTVDGSGNVTCTWRYDLAVGEYGALKVRTASSPEVCSTASAAYIQLAITFINGSGTPYSMSVDCTASAFGVDSRIGFIETGHSDAFDCAALSGYSLPSVIPACGSTAFDFCTATGTFCLVTAL